ncbi:DUF2169 family type VI secretion system accessory protein [Sorangium cellulosum]|uniref:DUF2169 domain-containing protein n=1 Tax=Sorangium cellulosum So0157-2 TaxID=1254432 RepID=S4Y1E5_SORCE|nr:DUF2169 domain-containing protein [Sorangium cellulosum]AGP36738.1 hypothetical protein SCE1572_20920 [Sorangium cellulosum So0157-2]
MKTVKPLRLGVMTSVFEVRRAPHLCVSLLAGFSLEEQPSLVPEAALWLSVTKELGPNVPLDVCRPKPNGEVLLSGKAYPPGGAAPVCSVRLRLGPIDKRLAVLGDRMWKLGVPTEPAPFSEMPLTWSRAFGGKGFAKNPVGRGVAPEKSGAGEVHFLPNVEDLRQLVKAPGDRPEPATFGPADLTLPERWARSGTYDERWLRTEAPGLPGDFDWSFFNVAAPDQRIDGFFSGGEPIELENVHPERPRIVSAVPAIAGRAFITRRTPGGEEWAEVPLRMETLHLLPGALLGVVIFRGVARVAEDDARDVLHLLAALDDVSQPRSAEYYRDVLARRLDKEKGHLHALRDRELLPAGASYAAFRADEVGIPGAQTERLVHKNLRAGAEARLAAIEEELEQFPDSKRSANVPKALPPEPPMPDVDEMADRVEELEKEMARARELVKRQTEEAVAKARASCEAAGLDWEEQQRKAKEGAAGPPRFSADEKLAELRALAERCRDEGTPHAQLEAHLADPEFERKLRWSENKLREMYQRYAHHFPPAAPPSALLHARRAVGREVALEEGPGALLDVAAVPQHGAPLGLHREGAGPALAVHVLGGQPEVRLFLGAFDRRDHIHVVVAGERPYRVSSEPVRHHERDLHGAAERGGDALILLDELDGASEGRRRGREDMATDAHDRREDDDEPHDEQDKTAPGRLWGQLHGVMDAHGAGPCQAPCDEGPRGLRVKSCDADAPARGLVREEVCRGVHACRSVDVRTLARSHARCHRGWQRASYRVLSSAALRPSGGLRARWFELGPSRVMARGELVRYRVRSRPADRGGAGVGGRGRPRRGAARRSGLAWRTSSGDHEHSVLVSGTRPRV